MPALAPGAGDADARSPPETPESLLLAACERMTLPSIRYAIGDLGGMLGYDEMLAFLAAKGFDPLALLAAGTTPRRLPFVWVFGRAHW